MGRWCLGRGGRPGLPLRGGPRGILGPVSSPHGTRGPWPGAAAEAQRVGGWPLPVTPSPTLLPSTVIAMRSPTLSAAPAAALATSRRRCPPSSARDTGDAARPRWTSHAHALPSDGRWCSGGRQSDGPSAVSDLRLRCCEPSRVSNHVFILGPSSLHRQQFTCAFLEKENGKKKRTQWRKKRLRPVHSLVLCCARMCPAEGTRPMGSGDLRPGHSAPPPSIVDEAAGREGPRLPTPAAALGSGFRAMCQTPVLVGG